MSLSWTKRLLLELLLVRHGKWAQGSPSVWNLGLHLLIHSYIVFSRMSEARRVRAHVTLSLFSRRKQPTWTVGIVLARPSGQTQSWPGVSFGLRHLCLSQEPL